MTSESHNIVSLDDENRRVNYGLHWLFFENQSIDHFLENYRTLFPEEEQGKVSDVISALLLLPPIQKPE